MVSLKFLKQKQALPLKAKINLTNKRIRDWYEYHNGKVFVSFSGGKDSLVLLHLVRKLYPAVPAVFCDTGLEYPEIKDFVRTFDNTIIIRPEISFIEVLKRYGYPVVSKKVARQIHDLKNPRPENKASRNLYLTGLKQDGSTCKSFKLGIKWRRLVDAPFKISDKCCEVMKKKPFRKYMKETKRKGFIGTLTRDSAHRKFAYLNSGCNNYKGGKSTPLSFWLEKDIWDYIKLKKLKYCSIYDTGVTNTGCIFCMFGVHLEVTPNRFQCMKKTHPQLYNYCLNKLGLKKVLEFIGVEY